MTACPTCGGPAREVWPPGRHRPEPGPEQSACGRCGDAFTSARHEAAYESRFPTVETLAEALHATGGPSCETDHREAGVSAAAAIRRHHARRAEAIIAALDGEP